MSHNDTNVEPGQPGENSASRTATGDEEQHDPSPALDSDKTEAAPPAVADKQSPQSSPNSDPDAQPSSSPPATSQSQPTRRRRRRPKPIPQDSSSSSSSSDEDVPLPEYNKPRRRRRPQQQQQKVRPPPPATTLSHLLDKPPPPLSPIASDPPWLNSTPGAKMTEFQPLGPRAALATSSTVQTTALDTYHSGGVIPPPPPELAPTGQEKEAFRIQLVLNLEVEITLKAKIHGDVTLSVL